MNSVNPTVVLTALARRSGWGNPEIAGKMLDRIPLGHFAGILLFSVLISGTNRYFNAFVPNWTQMFKINDVVSFKINDVVS